MSDSLQTHGQQQARLPCPSPTPELAHGVAHGVAHVHQVNDVIQPFHPLTSLSPPPSIFPSIRVFSNGSHLHIRWLKFWGFSFNISLSSEYSGLISFRMDWLGSPCCPGDSQESSPTPQFKSINSSALSVLYSPSLTSIHDYCKNHSLD